jgi:hypothetical protein
VHATTWLDPQAFGLQGFFTTPIELVIDIEFERRS